MKTKLYTPLVMLATILSGIQIQAQTTVLYTENFDSAATNSWSLNTSDLGSNTDDQSYWLINNDYEGGIVNNYEVDVINTPNEPGAIAGAPHSYYMHITTGSWSGVYDANFVAPGIGNVFAKMNAPIVTTGLGDITFSFWYLCNGGCPNRYYGRLYYSVDGGNTWVQEGGKYQEVSAWTKATVSNPAFSNRTDLRFAFQWVQTNADCDALDPAWAVDDIVVTGAPCTVSITGQTGTNPCTGPTGSITVTATGAGTLTYILSNSNYADTNNTGIFTGLAAGTYNFIVSDTNCSANGTPVTLTAPSAIIASSNSPVCSGNTLTLSASAYAGATYTWSGPNGFMAAGANASLANVTFAAGGPYVVVVTIPGCSADTITTGVTIDSCPVPQALYFEDFDSAVTYSWTLNTGDLGSDTWNRNLWYITNDYLGGLDGIIINTPDEPSGVVNGPESRYLHISSGPAFDVYNANFEAPAEGNVFTKMNAPVVTTGYSNVTLSFWYLCNGGCPYNYYGKLYYSVDGGNTWIQEGAKYFDVGNWQQALIADPAFDNRADLRFAYQWVQAGFCYEAADPGWALDDIEVTGVLCPVHIDSVTSSNPCFAGSTGSISITASGAAPLTYIISNGIVSDTNTTGQFLNELPAGTYTINVSTYACSAFGNNVTITSQSSVVANSNSPVCIGSAINLTANAVPGATYVWNGPNTFVDSTADASITGATFADTGVYTLTVTFPGCTGFASSADVAVDSCMPIDTVWPGDANADGIANNLDFLAIGIAWGQTGITRPDANNSWTGQPCDLWANSFSGGVNMNNADCNGDGVVNANDTIPLLENYSLTHVRSGGALRSPGSPPIYLQLVNPLVQAGGAATVNIELGNSLLQASSIYGLAFSIIYDGSLVVPGSLVTNYQNSWMGTLGSDMMVMQKSITDIQLDLAITRINHQTRTGDGLIGQLSFNTVSQLNGNETTAQLPIYVYGITAVDSAGNVIPLDSWGDTLTVQAVSGIDKLCCTETNLNIFPNPASGSIFITSTQNIDNYVIYNVEGQEVARKESLNALKATLDLTDWSKGVYVLEASVGGVKVVRRFAVM